MDRRGRLYETGSAQTAGSTLRIAGCYIQLPDDVYIDTVIDHASCEIGELCPITPFYVLVRGDSTVKVEGPTGKIFDENIAPGEEGAFDFLTEGTTGQIVSIDGIFVTLP